MTNGKANYKIHNVSHHKLNHKPMAEEKNKQNIRVSIRTKIKEISLSRIFIYFILINVFLSSGYDMLKSLSGLVVTGSKYAYNMPASKHIKFCCVAQ